MSIPELETDAALAHLRGALLSASPPPALEGALVTRFRRQHRAARPRLWWMPPLALVATGAIVSWMIRAPHAPPPVPLAPASVEADAGPFLALKPLDRIALEPGTTVVASEFPRALLAEWGLPVAPDRAAETVRAETLYSADGEALAIRLLN
jgi:hypothetical protein